ncbi:MAG TPA: hypothetical protein DCW60_00785, partial [Sutterella sp.]|nr:hypothetical protein [Sutterella sp.]
MKTHSLRLLTKTSFSVTCLLCATGAFAAPSMPADVLGNFEPGTQLNRTQEMFDRQKTIEQIEKNAHKDLRTKKPAANAHPARSVPEVSFLLKGLELDASEVLTKEELNRITNAYIHRKVRLVELYELVDKINDLYSEKGFVTCRAILPPQRIHNGIVKVRLIEGKTGKVHISNNPHTNDGYIRNRLSLDEGAIVNISRLNEDITRFNGTNDVQLQVALKAGEAVGTTDYEIVAIEPPKNQDFRIYADTNGYENNSRYRYGLMYTNRSVTGRRDVLTFSYLRSRGSDILGFAYSAPIASSATRAEISAGYNSNKVVNGYMEPLGVKGKAYNVGMALRHPLVIQEDFRAELSVEYMHQESQTDLFVKTSDKVRWVDGKTDKFTFSGAFTHY